MHTLYVLVILLAAACSSKDKCERVADKLAPLMKEQGKPDDPGALEKCRADLAANPDRERMLDCILSLDEPVTGPSLVRCANTDKYGGKRSP